MYKRAIFIGRVVTDIVVKQVTEGKVCNFSLGGDTLEKGEKAPEYFDFSAWDDNAVFLEKYIEKGERIFVECEPKSKKYKDTAGNNRRRDFFVVSSIQFADAKKEE